MDVHLLNLNSHYCSTLKQHIIQQVSIASIITKTRSVWVEQRHPTHFVGVSTLCPNKMHKLKTFLSICQKVDRSCVAAPEESYVSVHNQQKHSCCCKLQYILAKKPVRLNSSHHYHDSWYYTFGAAMFRSDQQGCWHTTVNLYRSIYCIIYVCLYRNVYILIPYLNAFYTPAAHR